MKKLITLILAFSLLLVNDLFSQTYNMATSVDTTCSGTFYDNGGLGLYTNSANFTQTFCSTTPGTVIKVNFTAFQTELSLDKLAIYDGPTTASPLIGIYSGIGTLIGTSFTSSSGCLTFNFTSDASIVYNGWTATLSCVYACQSFNVNPDSTFPIADTNNEIKICVGTPVAMYGNANYPNSGNYYNQMNSTSTFEWKTGDGFTIPGQNATHTFNMPGIFDISLVVTDTIGCTSFKKGARVIVSNTPNFRNISYYPNDTICFGDTAIITLSDSGLFTPFIPPSLNAAGVTFLPDGNGVSHRDTIPVSIFSPLATFGAGYLQSIYVNMEHSYLGDLEIRLTCPNGNTAILKQAAGGANTHLGEPVDPPAATPVPLNPGIGYTYEFTHRSPLYGTMVNESGVYQHNYTDVIGTTYTAQDYLPAGSYTPFQNLSTQLNGCPLNGNWIITVTDNIPIDNGYIFYWGLKFDSLIRPPNVVSPIAGIRDSSTWTSTSSILATPGDTTVVTSPLTSGVHSFNYKIFDNFGCEHDTTVDIFVKPKPKSNAGIDFVTCRLDYQLAPIPTPNNNSSQWSYYANSPTGNSVLTTPIIYNANTVVNEFSTFNYILNEIVDGCPSYPDTVVITHTEALNTIDIGINKDTICIPELVIFTNNSDMTYFDSIYWEFGDGNTSNTQGSATHTYNTVNCFNLKVTLVNSLGCKVDSTLTDVICAFPSPIANFTFDPFEAIVPETWINFTNTTSGATLYVWDFAGLGTSFLVDDSYEFPKTEGGSYPVTLYAANEGGCIDSITKFITIKNPLSIWIPTAFTPNKDGLNETFRVHFNNDAVKSYTLRIFNRWGETLFYSEDPDFEWDGTINGEEAPVGVYIWQINGKEEFETDSFTKFGHVTLSR
ncbi:PKD domain-containing protein [Flavobacteriales bacterium]|nr:PKD domain-containing protein [Flavobacteriales bacterium]